MGRPPAGATGPASPGPWPGQRLVFAVMRRYGLWLYGVKLGRVRRLETPEGVFYEKRRYGRSAPLLALANPLLRATRSPVLGLREREWLSWEARLAPITLGREAEVRGRMLRLPEIPGARLGDYLAAAPDSPSRRGAVAAAAHELGRLHGLTVRFPNGEERRFSHGDAHANNVLFEAATGRAVWFDFEAVHPARLPTPYRHADDWRAFGYSAVAHVPRQELPEVAGIIARACAGDATRAALSVVARRLHRCPSGFHLAQAPLDYPRHQQFCADLMEALEANPGT